jgi:hypothetical protein
MHAWIDTYELTESSGAVLPIPESTAQAGQPLQAACVHR